jgi:Putative transposase DNA-binding domain
VARACLTEPVLLLGVPAEHRDWGTADRPGAVGTGPQPVRPTVVTAQVETACGMKDGPKPLNVREWTCGEWGAVHDRDVNAARNILALGRRERLINARGGQV